MKFIIVADESHILFSTPESSLICPPAHFPSQPQVSHTVICHLIAPKSMRLPERVLVTISAFFLLAAIAIFVIANDHSCSSATTFSVGNILLAALTSIMLTFAAGFAFGLLLAFAAYGIFTVLDGGNCVVGF